MELPSYFRQAVRIAENSDHNQKMGACILKKNKVISVGCNQRYKTHPFIRRFDPHKTIHAEMAAIFSIKDKSKLQGATMVVYRKKYGDIPGLARPCSICQDIMRFFGITNMIYTTNEGTIEEESLSQLVENE